MYRLTAFLRKWPILSGFIFVMLVLWLMPSEQDKTEQAVQKRSKENYGVFQGTRQESAKVENADSAFVKNRLTTLGEQEYKLYARAFYTAMTQGVPNEIRSWQTRSAFGQLQTGELFEGSNGTACRNFSERYTVAKQTQTFSGKACRQKNGAWCKLRNDSVPTCDLTRPEGLGMFMEDTNTSLHNFNVDTNRVMHRLKNLF